MSREVWLPVLGYPMYLVSDHGRVFDKHLDRPVVHRPERSGLEQVTLKNEDGGRSHYIHRIVAHHFIRPINEDYFVKHKDGDRSNNHVNNLQLEMNPRLNKVSKRRAIYPRGRPVQILETGEVFDNAYECAYFIDGTHSAIYACLRGERLTHLGYTFQYID